MTRPAGVLSAGLLALLAACGSQQRVTPSEPARPPDKASSTQASASPPVAPRQAPQALVTDETQNRLLVVDLPDGRLARWVPLPNDPEDIAATRTGAVAVVVSPGSGKVTVLDGETLRTLKVFGGFDQPHIVAITPDFAYAYVTDDARGTLSAIRLSDLKITRTVQVGAGAHHLAISRDGRQVWVALGETAQAITILSTAVRRARPQSGAVIDPGHPRVIGHISPGFPAHDLSFSPDGRRVWISSATGPDVTVFDARTREPLFKVPAGPPPQHLAIPGRFAYLTSGYGGQIEKVDATTGRVVTRASAPYGSFELAAADGYVATVSLLRGTLAIYTPNLELLHVVKLAPATREVSISRP